MTDLTIRRTRRCSNCTAYDSGECMNGFGIVDAGGRCDEHKTHEEDCLEEGARIRLRAWLGLPPVEQP